MTHVIVISEFTMPTISTRRPPVRQEASLEPDTPRHPSGHNAFSNETPSVCVSQYHMRAMRDLSRSRSTPAA